MSLATRIESLVIRVAQEFNDVRATAGNLASLSTADKSSLVAAINELKAALITATAIDDGVVATTATYSSNKIVTLLDALERLVDGSGLLPQLRHRLVRPRLREIRHARGRQLLGVEIDPGHLRDPKFLVGLARAGALLGSCHQEFGASALQAPIKRLRGFVFGHGRTRFKARRFDRTAVPDSERIGNRRHFVLANDIGRE